MRPAIETDRLSAGVEVWPNGLGVNVGAIGEVWLSRPDGQWGVRSFDAAGDPERWLLVDPAAYLFLSYADAVALCQAGGNPIE